SCASDDNTLIARAVTTSRPEGSPCRLARYRTAAGIRGCYLRLLGEARLGIRLRDLGFFAGGDTAIASGGNTATASISSNAPSRARPEIAIVVLAGRSLSDR